MVKNLRVLLVEDNESFRRLVGDILRDEGYNVEALGTIRAASRRIETGARYDVVLTDLSFSGGDGDGCKLAKLVKNYDVGGHETKVALFSGVNVALLRDVSEKMGLDGYLQKPVGDKEILSFLDKL